MGKRASIDTIAEVLIDRLDDINRLSKKMEIMAKTPLKVEISPLEKHLDLIDKKTERQKAINSKNLEQQNNILEHYKKLKEQKEKTSVPKWIFIFMFICFIVTVTALILFFDQRKELEEYRNIYNKEQFQKRK